MRRDLKLPKRKEKRVQVQITNGFRNNKKKTKNQYLEKEIKMAKL